MIAIRANHKKWWMLAGCAALIACGSADASALGDFAPTADNGNTDAGGENTGATPTGADSGTAGAANSNPSVSGIIAVHASRNLPAFRLCFQTETSLLPLPYDKLMPNSNVVGVDVGTAVHFDSFAQTPDGGTGSQSGVSFDAGTTSGDSDGGEGGVAEGGTGLDAGPITPPSEAIWVIDEKLTRQFYPPGSDTSTWPSCGALVAVLNNNGFAGNGLYAVSNAANTPPASVLDNPETSPGVSLLVFEGCLPDSTLDTAACGSTYNSTTGNLTYRIISNLPVPNGVPEAGPGFSFQAMQLSPRVEFDRNNGQKLKLTFGALADINNGTSVPETLTVDTLVPAEGPLVVPFTPSSLGDYDSYGFALTAGATDGVSQSLATIQAQSSPADLPQTFYLLPSNFVVLIVGDPQVAPTANGPGASLHLLAVPVRDPASLEDAGAPIVASDGG